VLILVNLGILFGMNRRLRQANAGQPLQTQELLS
jgi:hypothetical protein